MIQQHAITDQCRWTEEDHERLISLFIYVAAYQEKYAPELHTYWNHQIFFRLKGRRDPAIAKILLPFSFALDLFPSLMHICPQINQSSGMIKWERHHTAIHYIDLIHSETRTLICICAEKGLT